MAGCDWSDKDAGDADDAAAVVIVVVDVVVRFGDDISGTFLLSYAFFSFFLAFLLKPKKAKQKTEKKNELSRSTEWLAIITIIIVKEPITSCGSRDFPDQHCRCGFSSTC